MGLTANEWDGSGVSWFKIYEESAVVKGNGVSWASLGESGS